MEKIEYNTLAIGVWRSLVSRLVRVQEAAGSNPATPTKSHYTIRAGRNRIYLRHFPANVHKACPLMGRPCAIFTCRDTLPASPLPWRMHQCASDADTHTTPASRVEFPRRTCALLAIAYRYRNAKPAELLLHFRRNAAAFHCLLNGLVVRPGIQIGRASCRERV